MSIQSQVTLKEKTQSPLDSNCQDNLDRSRYCGITVFHSGLSQIFQDEWSPQSCSVNPVVCQSGIVQWAGDKFAAEVWQNDLATCRHNSHHLRIMSTFLRKPFFLSVHNSNYNVGLLSDFILSCCYSESLVNLFLTYTPNHHLPKLPNLLIYHFQWCIDLTGVKPSCGLLPLAPSQVASFMTVASLNW